MTIKYKNEVEDLVEINIGLGKISIKSWIFNNIFPVIYTIAALLLVIYLAVEQGGFTAQVGAVIFLFIATSAFLWVNTLLTKRKNFRRAMMRLAKKNPDYVQQKLVVRTEKEMIVKNLENKKKTFKFRLNQIKKVVEKNNYVFILDEKDKPLVTIPLRAFSNEEEFYEFFGGTNVIRE